jgi:hypothetical protein
MNAERRFAFRAGSSPGLKIKEIFNPLLFDHHQVFQEAGPVFCSVSFIELLQSLAGVSGAVITKP